MPCRGLLLYGILKLSLLLYHPVEGWVLLLIFIVSEKYFPVPEST